MESVTVTAWLSILMTHIASFVPMESKDFHVQKKAKSLMMRLNQRKIIWSIN